MANRSVSVTLNAIVAPFVAGMGKASAATTAFARTTDRQLDGATGKTQKLGQAAGILPAKFGALSSVGGLAFAGVALAAGAAVKVFADFEQAMSAVEASTGATGKELDSLSDAAIEMGQTTVFSATEAARAIETLAKAGIETADIVGGALAGALDLAAAGGVDVALAAETAASAMTQFGLSGRDVPHIADLLAAGAGKAQGSVDDMSQALKQSGLVAAQMGLSIEDTTGTLAAFASAGLIGSDAGTSFRTMLLRLANPSGEARDLMEQLGIAAYDAQGQFVGIGALAGQLRSQLGGLTQEQRNAALAIIFGSDAIRGANVLYEQGSKGIGAWRKEVNDAGFAAEQAAKRTDNLRGDIEKLGGAWESFALGQAGPANDALRELVQTVTGLIGVLEDADAASRDFFDTWNTQGNKSGEPTAFGEGLIRGLDTLTFGLFSQALAADKGTEALEAQKAATERVGIAALEHAENLAGYTTSTWNANAATDATATSAITAAESLEELREEAFKTSNEFLGLRDAEVGVEQAVDDVIAAFEKNGETLDISTQAGQENRTALDNQADSALRLMQQMYDTGASEEEVTEKAGDLREGLAQSARRFGLTKTEAYNYADQILKIPTTRTTTPTFADTNARAKVAAFQKLIQGIDQTVGVRINVSTGGMGGLGGFFTGVAPGGMPWAGRYPVTQGPHDGGAIDYGMPVGVPLRATFPGFVDFSDAGGTSYGKYYVLRGGGKYELLAHMSGFARGDGLVGTGALLGWSGNTGNSTGPHAHLLRNFAKGGPIGGVPGASVPINAHGGEYIVNAAATARNRAALEAINSGTSGRIVLEVHSGGSRYDDFLASELRRHVRVNGGNVQTVLGAS